MSYYFLSSSVNWTYGFERCKFPAAQEEILQTAYLFSSIESQIEAHNRFQCRDAMGLVGWLALVAGWVLLFVVVKAKACACGLGVGVMNRNGISENLQSFVQKCDCFKSKFPGSLTFFLTLSHNSQQQTKLNPNLKPPLYTAAEISVDSKGAYR
eukprot:scaffold32789_cov23-Cyclotella_meneghiniana.AAC.1